MKCRQQNLHPQHYAPLHLEVSSIPMHLIVMDLIGKFKLSPLRHKYSLTVIDIWMKLTWCIPLFTKQADEVVHGHIVNVYSKFAGLYQILSDSNT